MSKQMSGSDNSAIQLEWVQNDDALRSAKFTLPLGALIYGWKIPAGFKTDGASLPRPIRVLVSPFGALLPAAIVHDYLLSSLPGQREVAAHEFRRILKLSGVSAVVRQLAYWAVRFNDYLHKFGLR